MLEPGAEPAWCSVNDPDSRCRIYSSGFTAIVDIAAARPSQRGHIYVLEHASPLYLRWVHGQGGSSLTGRLIRASGRNQVEVETKTRIEEPQNIVVMSSGAIYLTDWVDNGYDGRLLKVWD